MINIFLNHFAAIIDRTTYEEINKSSFLRDNFCHCKEKTHSDEKRSWTGFYMTGENTYLEIFNYKDQKSLYSSKISNIGIGLSVDHKDEIEKITEILKQKFPENITYGIQEKNIVNKLVKWFYYVEIPDNSIESPQLNTWVMAYHKDYIFKLNRENITRKEYNQEYNAVQYDKNKLFKDIKEITLLLNEEAKIKLTKIFISLGYNPEETQYYTIFIGPEIKFKVIISKDHTCRILNLQMSLNKKISSAKTYTLGNSSLTLENQTARWEFK
jgi:hypothetical protein